VCQASAQVQPECSQDKKSWFGRGDFGRPAAERSPRRPPAGSPAHWRVVSTPLFAIIRGMQQSPNKSSAISNAINWILAIASFGAFATAAMHAVHGDRSQAILYLVCAFALMGFFGYRLRQAH
jgi:hypothetical protein